MAITAESLRRALPLVAVLLVLGWLGYGWLQEASATDEEKIRASLVRIESAIAERDLGAFMDEISSAYSDRMHKTPDPLQDRVRYFFFANLKNKLEITFTDVRVTVADDPDPTTATVRLGVTGSPPIQSVYKKFFGSREEAELTYTRSGSTWQIQTARKAPRDDE